MLPESVECNHARARRAAVLFKRAFGIALCRWSAAERRNTCKNGAAISCRQLISCSADRVSWRVADGGGRQAEAPYVTPPSLDWEQR